MSCGDKLSAVMETILYIGLIRILKNMVNKIFKFIKLYNH